MQETESIDEYILQHIDPESDYLKALYRAPLYGPIALLCCTR